VSGDGQRRKLSGIADSHNDLGGKDVAMTQNVTENLTHKQWGTMQQSVRWAHALRILLVAGMVLSAWGQSAADLLAEIDAGLDPVAAELPDNTRRAEAIAELVAEDLGLPAAEVHALRLALAQAWLQASATDDAQKIAAALVADAGVLAKTREEAALLWIVAWQEALARAEKPEALPAPLAGAWPQGKAPRSVQVRALTAEAARQVLAARIPDALAAYDRALALLADAPPEDRVPVYLLRLLAMERPEPDPEAITAWLQAHREDPAMAQVASAALTAGQQLIGQPAPPFQAKRIDGQAGNIDLATFKGSVVLLDYFATWCQPCLAVAPVVSAVQQRYAKRGLITIGVSLDTKETAGQLPDFIKRHRMEYPIVGELLGWDGELEKIFHVDGIPALILIGADGRIAAVDLVGSTPEETTKRLSEAIENALRAPAGPVPVQGGLMNGVLP